MTVPTTPAVSDAMREAVAPVTRAEVRACIGPTIPLRRRWVDLLMRGPIARLQAEIARLTGERGEMERGKFAALGLQQGGSLIIRQLEARAEAAEAETARLRAENAEARAEGRRQGLEEAAKNDHSKDFQLLIVRIIQRHRNGRDLTETLEGAADLLRRKGSLSPFRATAPAETQKPETRNLTDGAS